MTIWRRDANAFHWWPRAALEPTELPSFAVGLSNVMARTGQKVRLECAVAGLPFPVVTWLHNNKPVKETRDIKVSPAAIVTASRETSPKSEPHHGVHRSIRNDPIDVPAALTHSIGATQMRKKPMARNFYHAKTTFSTISHNSLYIKNDYQTDHK